MADFRPDFAPIPDQIVGRHDGRPFKVVATLENAAMTADGDPYDIYRIEFEDGAQIDAFPEEVRTDHWHNGSERGMRYAPKPEHEA